MSSSRAKRLAARNKKKEYEEQYKSSSDDDMLPKSKRRKKKKKKKKKHKKNIVSTKMMKCDMYFGLVSEYLYTFNYVQSLCRVSKYHYQFAFTTHNEISSTIKCMILREFGKELYGKQCKGQENDVYGCIRWLYGLFRSSGQLERDPFYQYGIHGGDYGWDFGMGSNSTTFCRTYFLMTSPPKLLFPITYGFSNHYAKYIRSIASMTWKFEYGEKQNVFEWMLKLLFADDASMEMVEGFYDYIIYYCSKRNDPYFTKGGGENLWYMFKDMMTFNLTKCKPYHAWFWFDTVCWPRLMDEKTMSNKAVKQFLDEIINGLHGKICKECHVEDSWDRNKTKWEPDEWKKLLFKEDVRGKIKKLGMMVGVKDVAKMRNEWYWLRKECNEYRNIIGDIFEIEYFENFEEKRLITMGIPKILHHYKWLYRNCNLLTKETRNKIILFMTGKYKKVDIETEDVLLNRLKDETNTVIKTSVFRMFFKTKKWKKLILTKKLKNHQ